MSYSISSYTEDSFTFAACHGNRKDDPDGGDDDDDDDCDDNDDDGDDDDDKYLSKNLQNPWQLKEKLTSNYTKKLIPKNPEIFSDDPGIENWG